MDDGRSLQTPVIVWRKIMLRAIQHLHTGMSVDPDPSRQRTRASGRNCSGSRAAGQMSPLRDFVRQHNKRQLIGLPAEARRIDIAHA